MDVPYAVKLCSVNISEWKMEEEISAGENAQFRFQGVGPLWTYAFQKFNVGVEIGHEGV
jgi:hypothetical protein